MRQTRKNLQVFQKSTEAYTAYKIGRASNRVSTALKTSNFRKSTEGGTASLHGEASTRALTTVNIFKLLWEKLNSNLFQTISKVF